MPELAARACTSPTSWQDESWRALRGRPGLVLGNSPAVAECDFEPLRDLVTLGVNRILRVTTPAALVIVDRTVMVEEEARLRAFDGRLALWEGLGSTVPRLRERFPHTRFLLDGSGPPFRRWPERLGDRLLLAGNTATYAIQLAVLLGLDPIGVLGVDFNARDLARAGRPTHGVGEVPRRANGGGRMRTRACQGFFSGVTTWAAGHGSRLYNLSPYDDSPFTRAGWLPRLRLEHFLSLTRGSPEVAELDESRTPLLRSAHQEGQPMTSTSTGGLA